MPAYNSSFITQVPTTSEGVPAAAVAVTVTSNISHIDTKELLVAGGELIWAGSPSDLVEQIVSHVPLVLTATVTGSVG